MNGKKVAVGVIVVALAGAAGAAWWYYGQGGDTRNHLTLHGNVDLRQVALAFNVSGRVARVLVQEGDRVQPGQVLAELDTEQLRHAVAEAEAKVDAQTQVVARLEAGSRPEEIRQAEAQVEAARADTVNAEQNYRRLQSLAKQNFVSQQRADESKYALDAARARLNAVEETLRLLRAGPRREDIAAAKATLAAQQAALALARRTLEDGSLKAPQEAVVENRILEVGDMASPQQPVYTLALVKPIWVRAYVSEPDLGKLRPGDTAYVLTDSYPGKRYRAWIGFISPTAEFTPKAVQTEEVRTTLVYQVRVFVCHAPGELRLGMPATVHVPLDQPTPPPPDPCTEPA
jgi:HlyD family secretion protein